MTETQVLPRSENLSVLKLICAYSVSESGPRERFFPLDAFHLLFYSFQGVFFLCPFLISYAVQLSWFILLHRISTKK